MNVFIVYAHPEPKSFNHAMLSLAREVFTDHGHEVVVSDLYRMGFNPVAGRHDFSGALNPDFFDYAEEQRHGFRSGQMAPEIEAEHRKLVWCDLLILQFPMWWYGVPAIAKGWIDRVMSVGFAYDAGMKFDRGGLRGRFGMVATTTAATEDRFTPGVSHAFASLEDTLKPLNRGVFRYVGIVPLDPFVAWAVNRTGPDERAAYLMAYRDRLTGLARDGLPARAAPTEVLDAM